MFAVSFPSIFSFALLLHHSSFFFFPSVLSFPIYFAPCWQSYFEVKWMVHITWWCSCSSALTSPGCLRAAENAAHNKGWEPRIYFAVILSVDPFPVMYSGHLDASGRKENKIKHRRKEKLQKNIWVANYVLGNKFGMTMLHGQACLWSAGGDMLE